MKYKNEKTGAVIEIDSVLSGGDWKEVKTSSRSSKEKDSEKDETICENE